jgi:hypothetical protein
MEAGMHEIRRMAYLEALGIDSYVSRNQLPGAAPTRRLAIVSTRATPLPQGGARETPSVRAIPTPAQRREAGTHPGVGPVAHMENTVPLPVLVEASLPRGPAVPRFSLTAIVAGDWLWLEELAGMPLTTEQVTLVQSMAQALIVHREPRTETGIPAARPVAAPPAVAQFDWPIHTNHQLDLGADAARASVAGFVGRRLEQHGCHGLVLLGQSCALRVPLQEIKILTVSTASSAEILARPALKRTVWRDLLPLVRKL